MKRRLTIARSLVNDPEVLLLDEPTTGLDPQARHVVWDRLFRLKQRGVTLVLTTHYMDEAEQLCDRLVIMDRGKIAQEGSPLELIRRLSTREVVELRFADERAAGRAGDVQRPGRTRRGAAGPPASLHRRRRRARPGRARAAAPGRACSSGARRSKTSSSASRAERSSTDGVLASRVRVLARRLPPRLARDGHDERPQPGALPHGARRRARQARQPRRTSARHSVSRLRRAGNARGRRDAGRGDRVELPGARRDPLEPSVLRDARDAAAGRATSSPATCSTSRRASRSPRRSTSPRSPRSAPFTRRGRSSACRSRC